MGPPGEAGPVLRFRPTIVVGVRVPWGCRFLGPSIRDSDSEGLKWNPDLYVFWDLFYLLFFF